jgi:hypothetical protein
MIHTICRSIVAVLILAFLPSSSQAFPEPSPYPISWDLRFDYQTPKRLVVRTAPGREPEAFWYMTFTVANLSREEHNFLPRFEMLSNEGEVFRSDSNIPLVVLETIRIKEHNARIEGLNDMAGILRVGEDQGREGVAIWREPSPKMGRFSIFATGLSGEAVILKNAKGKAVERTNPEGKKEPVVLWKTLQLDYHMAGDEKNPGNDVIELVEQKWIMR